MSDRRGFCAHFYRTNYKYSTPKVVWGLVNLVTSPKTDLRCNGYGRVHFGNDKIYLKWWILLSACFGRIRLLCGKKMIAAALAVFLIVTGLVKYFLHVRHFESYVKHVKMGNRSLPFVGNAWSLIGKSTATLFKEITEVTKLNGTPLKGYMGPALIMSLDRPDDIKTVLMSSNCLDKPYLYQFYPRPCGILNARCKPSTLKHRADVNLK